MLKMLLLVDDAPDMGVLVGMLGRRAGVEVVHRTTVADGWAALQERRPELLLLDMRLPGPRDGADLCRRIRTAPAFADLRVALFVNNSLHEDICAGLEAGADLLFAKDLMVQEDEWRRRLAEILVWTHGRVWANLVAWNAERAWPTPPADWLARYNGALRQAVARRISGQVVRIVLKRAVLETLARENRQDEVHSWLHAEEAALEEQRAATATNAEFVAFLGAALAEQMWCLLGSRDSAFFTAALTSVVPGLTESCC
jgi:two-component system, OmpR family, phosphate regulon response regulator PhoB